MSSAQLGFRKYDDDDAFYVENFADSAGDVLDPHPAIRELQESSKRAILNAIQKPSNVVVKVSRLGPPRDEIKGYVTLERFVQGATPQALEKMLGFRAGVLADGCRVSYPEVSALTQNDIGPRYLTSWSAGVSPRDLHNLGEKAGAAVGYHRDYPAASDPIPQFVIFRLVKVRSTRILHPGERLEAL
jgi:hypothetical protein